MPPLYIITVLCMFVPSPIMEVNKYINNIFNEGEMSKRAKCLGGKVSYFTRGEMSKRVRCPVPLSSDHCANVVK